MKHDTATEEGRSNKLARLVRNYSKYRNWRAIARLIGGTPREDLQDHIPGKDDGEPPHGAEW